jgi:hypothetical protein
MRGLPGSGRYQLSPTTFFFKKIYPSSGKSTLVNILKRLYSKSVIVCSADNYFLDNQGVYNFNRDRLGQAHTVCQQQAEDACK